MSISDLFRPRWMHSDSGIRLAAVRELTDMAVLAEIARADKAPAVRRAALENRYFSSPDTLKDVALLDPDASVRLAAVALLASKRVLAQLAEADPSDEVQQAARRKLDGIPSDPSDEARQAATRELQAASRKIEMGLVAGPAAKIVASALAGVVAATRQRPANSLKGLGEDPEVLTDTAWRLFEELIVLSLHWADRQAFVTLGPNRRSAFMDQLYTSTVSSLAHVMRAADPELGAYEAVTRADSSLGPLYARRQRQYGPCAEFVSSPGAPAKGTVFWEAAHSLADDLFPGEAMAFVYLHVVIGSSVAGIREDVSAVLVGVLPAS